jgi:hypothetical protein
MKGHDVSFDQRSLTHAAQGDHGRDERTRIGVSADDVAVLGLRRTRPPCSTRGPSGSVMPPSRSSDHSEASYRSRPHWATHARRSTNIIVSISRTLRRPSLVPHARSDYVGSCLLVMITARGHVRQLRLQRPDVFPQARLTPGARHSNHKICVYKSVFVQCWSAYSR